MYIFILVNSTVLIAQHTIIVAMRLSSLAVPMVAPMEDLMPAAIVCKNGIFSAYTRRRKGEMKGSKR